MFNAPREFDIDKQEKNVQVELLEFHCNSILKK
jgi:hypothetical protein